MKKMTNGKTAKYAKGGKIEKMDGKKDSKKVASIRRPRPRG